MYWQEVSLGVATLAMMMARGGVGAKYVIIVAACSFILMISGNVIGDSGNDILTMATFLVLFMCAVWLLRRKEGEDEHE